MDPTVSLSSGATPGSHVYRVVALRRAYKTRISIRKWPIEQMSIFKIGKAGDAIDVAQAPATAGADEKNGRKKINHPENWRITLK